MHNKELEEIKKQLESTLEGFKDAYENYGYDLANERYYVETALKKVNLLSLPYAMVSREYVSISPCGYDEVHDVWYKCSNCGSEHILESMKYCPDCGGKIDSP